MDLNKMVNDTMKELSDSGYVQERVEHHLKQTIDKVLDDTIDSWSNFGKELKKQVQEQMQFNLDKLDLPSYNHVIMNVIKGEIERNIHEEGAASIQKQLQEILGTAEEEYKLSKLIKEMVEQDCEDNLEDLGYEEYHEITVIVEDKYGSKYVYLDPSEDDVTWYQCKYQITLDDDGTVRRVEIGDKSFDNKVIMGGLYGFDATLFKMWTRKAKVVIDSYDTQFGNPEYE
jgi:hypothetical protein